MIIAVLFLIANIAAPWHFFKTGRVYNEPLLTFVRGQAVHLNSFQRVQAADQGLGRGLIKKDPEALTYGLVTFRFDDGFESVYQNALPILEEAGFKGVVGVISDKSGKPFNGYLSWEQIRRLQEKRWEIGSHSVSHPLFDKLSEEEITFEVRESKETILRHGVEEVSTFILPYFDSPQDEVVHRIVLASGYENYGSNFGLVEVTPGLHNLRAITCESLSLEEIKAYIDRAEKDQQWAILLFHRIDRSGAEYSVTPEKFKDIVEYVKMKQVQAVTIKEGVDLSKERVYH